MQAHNSIGFSSWLTSIFGARSQAEHGGRVTSSRGDWFPYTEKVKEWEMNRGGKKK